MNRVGLVVLVVLATTATACGSESDSRSIDTASADDGTSVETSTAQPEPTLAVAIRQPIDGCDQPPAATWEQTGTMHTVVMSTDPIAVAVAAASGDVCPGGTVELTVTFTNEGSQTLVVAAPRLILSGGMDKWDLATLDDVEVEPGQAVEVAATVTLPLVAPGTYGLFVYGFVPGGQLVLGQPTG